MRAFLRRRRDDAGFGLIEAVVALMLLAIVIVPVTRVVITTLNSDSYLHYKSEAADLATSALESAQYQTANGVNPIQGSTTTTQYSGRDAFSVTVGYALVAGTSTSSNLCTAGGGAIASQIWQVNATVTWGTANDKGNVQETTLISPTTPDLANSNAAELAVPVFNADDATLESTVPVTLTAVASCSLGAQSACGTPLTGTVTSQTASTNLIGCAVFPNLYAGVGEVYSITATPNTVTAAGNYVDPYEYLGTPSINGSSTVILQSNIAVAANSVTIANSPNVILGAGVPTTFNFQTTAFSGSGSTTTTSGSSSSTTTTGASTTSTTSGGSTTTTTAPSLSATMISLKTNCVASCNRSVGWTAQVSVIAPGSGTPTGTVTFSPSNGLQGSFGTCGTNGVVTLPPSGTAKCAFTVRSGTSGGTIDASYSGDSNFAASDASIFQTGGSGVKDSYLVLTPSTDPSTAGNNVTFTATMSNTNGNTPTGTVAFTNNGTSISGCSAVAVTTGGTAPCTYKFTSAGNFTIAATYTGGGSENDQASEASITQIVAGASTTTTTSASTTTTSSATTTTTSASTTTTTTASTTTTTSPNAGGVLPAAYLPISIRSSTLLCNTLGSGTCVLGNGTSSGGFSSVTPQSAVLFPGPATTPDYTAWAGDQADSEPFWLDSSGVAVYGSTSPTSFTASATTTSATVTLPVYPLSLTVTTKSGVTLTGLTAQDAGGGDTIALNPVSGGGSATGLPLGQFLLGAVVSSGASTVTLTAGGTSSTNTAPVYVWILPNGVCTSSTILTTPCSSPSTSAITVQIG